MLIDSSMWQEHKPDELDKACDKVFDAIKDAKSPAEKIALLEQCIDYLRMDVVADETVNEEIIENTRRWLGPEGTSFFRGLKEKYGSVAPVYPEPTDPSLPHPVHFREGMQVRNFLRQITNNSWTAQEYDDRWIGIIEKAIE